MPSRVPNGNAGTDHTFPNPGPTSAWRPIPSAPPPIPGTPNFPKSRSDLSLEAYTERAAAHPWDTDQQIIALGGQCIGSVSRYEEDPAGGGWFELGIVIFDPAHWSGGLGTRALRLWTACTFSETSAHVITLSTWSGNQRMIRAAEKVGYRECARIPEARAWDGQRWDSVKLAVLRRDWL